MIEVNLVPDVKQELIRAQRVRAAVISISILAGIIAIGVVVMLAVYSYGVQSVRSAILDGNIKSGSDKLASVEDLSKTLTIQNQLEKMSSLNSEKTITSRVFDMLNAIIPREPNDVKISNLRVDTSTNFVTIEGQAQNSYAAVEVFRKTIEGSIVKYTTADQEETQQVPLATNVSTSDTSYGEDSSGVKVLRFTMSFTYATELFAPTSKNVKIEVTTKGNATDSYLGVPKSIFVDRAKDLEGEG